LENDPIDGRLIAFIKPFDENREKEMNGVVGHLHKLLVTKGMGKRPLTTWLPTWSPT